tara:strand:- start:110 stop:550 length:441 start_codon:yes stop_codon:yes gene_type:complete
MGKVVKIAISKDFENSMESVAQVDAIAGKGLIGDRYFKENNENKSQITLIEIENINYYNITSETSIDPINFRRNIITQDIKLNDLLGLEFFIGEVKVKAHDLCRPCKELQDKLKQVNFLKKLINKGGLRCEILSNGKILVGDKIFK